MKRILLLPFFLLTHYCFSQSTSDTAYYPGDGKHIAWISQLSSVNPDSVYLITDYYENGRKRSERNFDQKTGAYKWINAWSEDSTYQIYKSNGVLHEFECMDSALYQVRNGVVDGEALFYRKKYHSGSASQWQLYCKGNMSLGKKQSIWYIVDSAKENLFMIDYSFDTIVGYAEFDPVTHAQILYCDIKQNVKNGRQDIMDSAGFLLSRCGYRNGEKYGFYSEFYVNGKTKCQGNYTQVTHTFKTYAEDPLHPGEYKKIVKITLSNVPAKDGTWTYYNEDGTLLKTVVYKNEIEIPESIESYSFGKKVKYLYSGYHLHLYPQCRE